MTIKNAKYQGLELIKSDRTVDITGWYKFQCHQEGKHKDCTVPDNLTIFFFQKGQFAPLNRYCDHSVYWKLELRHFGRINTLNYFLNLINFKFQNTIKKIHKFVTGKRNTVPAPYLITGQTVKVSDWYRFFNHADSQYNVPGDHGDCNGLDYHEAIRMLFKKGDIVPGIMSCDHIVKWKLWR